MIVIPYSTINWFFGSIFLCLGLLSSVNSPLAGLCLISISLMLLPPVREFVHQKTHRKVPRKLRAATILILFISFVVFIGQSQSLSPEELAAMHAKEMAEMEAKVQQESIDYFNENRDQIIAGVKSALISKEYQSVVTLSAGYLVSGDKELLRMNSEAKTAMAEIEKAKRTEDIIDELRSVPESDYERNRRLFQSLVDLHPENDNYKRRLTFFKQMIDEEARAKNAANNRKQKIDKQFNSANGAHANLERLIKKTMENPASYKHDKTDFWDMGDHLVVRIIYTGDDGAGSLVKNIVKAKVSLDGEIMSILGQEK